MGAAPVVEGKSVYSFGAAMPVAAGPVDTGPGPESVWAGTAKPLTGTGESRLVRGRRERESVRVAIIGSGIAGLYVAHRMAAHCDLSLFEAANYPGGHSNTVEAAMDGQRLAIDTGFIVFNERTYPLFTALLKSLGVAYQPSDMSFSFRCGGSGLEYRGDNAFNAIFAQRRNAFRPSFYRMIRDILRFNGMAPVLVGTDPAVTLGQYLDTHGFKGPVVDNYLLPMASAIWSSEPGQILDFPACHFGRFFRNHGLLQVEGRPQWMTVTGGSREYVRAIVRPLRDRVHLNAPAEWIERHPDHVTVKIRDRAPQDYDQVVIATHSDQALALLRDPSPAEREILGAIPYQVNEAVLHTDAKLMPRRRRAWAAWNYLRDPARQGPGVSVTYNLTRLQSLPTKRQFLVTLNHADAMDPRTVIQRISYTHPVFTREGIRAQERHGEINGVNRTFYCGAYWGYGFHEDGVRSAVAVCDAFARLPGGGAVRHEADRDRDAQLYLQGTG